MSVLRDRAERTELKAEKLKKAKLKKDKLIDHVQKKKKKIFKFSKKKKKKKDTGSDVPDHRFDRLLDPPPDSGPSFSLSPKIFLKYFPPEPLPDIMSSRKSVTASSPRSGLRRPSLSKRAGSSMVASDEAGLAGLSDPATPPLAMLSWCC